MADWIKMRIDIYRDPKVSMIADLLEQEDSDLSRHVNAMMRNEMAVTRNVTRNAVVGALVSVWGVMRKQGTRFGDDLMVRGAYRELVDDTADIPGFGAAMAAVGWLREHEKGLVFPAFFKEHNTEYRHVSSSAERQKRWRDRQKSLRNSNENSVTRVTSRVTLRNAPETEKETENIRTNHQPEVDDVSAKEKPKKSNGKKPYSETFLRFWEVYPRKTDKGAAARAFEPAVKHVMADRDVSREEAVSIILGAASAYSRSVNGTEARFIKHASTWLSARSFDDDACRPGSDDPMKNPNHEFWGPGGMPKRL